ncbi:mediator of RNA polymerase II transcription subunit 15 [Drosophila madeirensis]|uniref:Mediator of RNA polymerase II transcription subunit 15 n=1 Tax=Drosophila madeirensis TaxID=30013 RepID=A0AAU9G2F8_DROMD
MALIRVLAVIGYCLVAVSGGVEIETLTPKAAADKIEDAATTKLTPSLTEDAKSKTEKRDSADQTGAIFPGRPTKETPFRPIYPSASYYEAPTQIFGPTTVRYTAAEAAPQTYYDKPESGSGIRYAPSGAGHKPSVQFAQQAHRFSFAAPPQVELYQRPAATKSASLGAAQQQQQQQKQQQQQREIFNYGEVEAEGGAIYERAGPQQYQLTLPVHHQHKFQQQPQQQQQPRVQYIIAIPLSYMRQLQQQQQQQHQLLVAPPTPSASPSSSSTTTTSSSAAPPSTAAPGPRHHQSFMQLLGPLARDHQGLYRPYYQSDAASAPLTGIGTPAGPNPSPPSHQQQQYFQIPASLLLAAAQQLQQQHQQQSQQQAVYAKAAPPPPPPPPPPSYQQLIYQAQPQAQAPQHHPQLQLQRIFLQPPQAQTSAIYAEQPGGTLYAYPRLKQQQQQKYTPATDSVAAGPTAATAAAAGDVAATTAEAATATRPTAQHLPIVHYNPIYVQAPAEQQHQQQQQQQQQHHQLQLQQHQFAILPRFSNNNPKAAYNLGHESTPPIHVVRLSAAGAPGHGHGHGHGHGPVPFHHFHHYQPGSVPLLQQLYHAPQQQQQYVSHMPYGHEEVPLPGPVSLPTTVPGMTGASPAIIPYFSHPGAVHYGTHLYHPAAAGAATAATKGGAAAAAATGAGAGAGVGVGSAATSPKQQSTSGGHSPGGGNNIVKYP